MTEPDPSQERVIDAPATDRLLVEAPPGAGKTWTASRRLVRLANEDRGDDDSDGRLLALSFSRVAALAITTELYRSGIGTRVEVRTIDSWCSATLVAAGAGTDELFGHNFDRRIEMLLELLSNQDELPAYRHVVVDEAQDVMGTRARLIAAVLTSDSTSGWTVLGDPAQTIYDFSDTGPTLFDIAAASGARREPLAGAHRARTAEIASIVDLGLGLRVAVPTVASLSRVRTAHMSLRKLDQNDLTRVAPGYARGTDSTAVLVRDNRIALTIAEQLADAGVPFGFVAARAEGLLPSWLAALSAPDRPWLEEADILTAVPDGMDVAPIVRAVRVLGGVVGERAGLDSLADGLLAGRTPEPLLQPPIVPLSISTVHRAKGLEFDRVLVGLPEHAHVDELAECRVLYVAMTRAKNSLIRLAVTAPQTWRRDPRSGRMVDVRFAGRNKQIPISLELRPRDIDPLMPWTTVSERVPQMSLVGMGERITLRLLTNHQSELPTYEATVGPERLVIGRTRPELGSALVDLGWKPPERLCGGRVMGLQSVVVPRGAIGARVRLIESPVVRGMLTRDGENEDDR